mmetsp:Transcript_9933/g.22822  ORF Transcript_9933/g.22822 Transcript_9933/m.22822 type:complete len:192 (+) Transcript_9933:73-648(+)
MLIGQELPLDWPEDYIAAVACPAPSRVLLVGNALLAIVHVRLAIHLQRKVWEAFVPLVEEEEVEFQMSCTCLHRRGPGELAVNSLGKVLLYDVPVCLYIFLLLGIAAWKSMGLGQAPTTCQRAAWTALAENLASAYPCVALVLFVLWVCVLRTWPHRRWWGDWPENGHLPARGQAVGDLWLDVMWHEKGAE